MAQIIFRPQGHPPVKASTIEAHGSEVTMTLGSPGVAAPEAVLESREIDVTSWLDQEERIKALQDQLKLTHWTFYLVSAATVFAAVLTHC